MGSPEVKEGLKGQGGSESPESHTVLEVDLEGSGGSEGSGGLRVWKVCPRGRFEKSWRLTMRESPSKMT